MPADAAAVNAVAVAAFSQYRSLYDDWDRLVAGVGATADLHGDGEIIVAEGGDGSIAGAVAYFGPNAPKADMFAPEWPIIRMLVVDPARRGAGIGWALTEACMARARRDGARVIALHTSPVMAVALRMYLRLGFALVRQVPDRFSVPYGVYACALEPAT